MLHFYMQPHACKSYLVNYHDYAENYTVTAETVAPGQIDTLNLSLVCPWMKYSGTMQSAEHRGEAEQPKALTPSGAQVKSIHGSYIIKSNGDQLTEQ